jgi:hypothetical protein
MFRLVLSLRAGNPLTEQTTLRFAVGTFDTWPQVRAALRDGYMRGLVLDNFNCVALERVFTGKVILAPSQEPVIIRTLPFPGNADPIACTSGALADHRPKDFARAQAA